MKLTYKPNRTIIDTKLKLVAKFDAKGEHTTTDTKKIALLEKALAKPKVKNHGV